MAGESEQKAGALSLYGASLASDLDACMNRIRNIAGLTDETGSSVLAPELSELRKSIDKLADALKAHVEDEGNPHVVQAGQVGADIAGTAEKTVAAHNVDETAHKNLIDGIATAEAGVAIAIDEAKRDLSSHNDDETAHADIRESVSAAQSAADSVGASLQTHINDKNNPHAVTERLVADQTGSVIGSDRIFGRIDFNNVWNRQNTFNDALYIRNTILIYNKKTDARYVNFGSNVDSSDSSLYYHQITQSSGNELRVFCGNFFQPNFAVSANYKHVRFGRGIRNIFFSVSETETDVNNLLKTSDVNVGGALRSVGDYIDATELDEISVSVLRNAYVFMYEPSTDEGEEVSDKEASLNIEDWLNLLPESTFATDGLKVTTSLFYFWNNSSAYWRIRFNWPVTYRGVSTPQDLSAVPYSQALLRLTAFKDDTGSGHFMEASLSS